MLTRSLQKLIPELNERMRLLLQHETDLVGNNISITLNDMCAAADALTVSGRVVINPESDVQYCLFIASRVTGISFEHLTELKTRDIMRIRTAIKRTFYGRE